MKKFKFKFKIDQRVFVLGRRGVCVVTGRGSMEFSSGGIMPYYVLQGAHPGFLPENTLINQDDAYKLANYETL